MANRLHLDERTFRVPRGLARSREERVVAGVAGGVGRYLGVDPLALRLALVVLSLANGAGAVLYLVAWGVLPAASYGSISRRKTPSAERTVGLALLTIGTLLLFGSAGLVLPAGFVWAAVFAALGFGLVWARTDEPNRTNARLLRSLGGGVLLVVGLGLLFASGGALETIGQVGLAVLATGVGVSLLLGPWILRLWQDLGVERRERIRSEERSEIAAHLHDSVLQTLALIQRADAPGRARTLARRQERELRAWLFDERPPHGVDGESSLAASLERVVTEVEDQHDVEVDLVVVGECPREPRLDALVEAIREATLNAARHAGVDDVSVYVEVEADKVTAFVRDRGRGFVPAEVEPERVGVRESIIGRMARHGGRAEVQSTPGSGTEVMLEVGRNPEREPSA